LETQDDIFSDNTAASSFAKLNVVKEVGEESTESNYTAARPIENTIENKDIVKKRDNIKIGYYANMPEDVILKDVAKLNDSQITIIKMYREITELKEQLKKDHEEKPSNAYKQREI
jgi:cellulose synthase (UDP-forming)